MARSFFGRARHVRRFAAWRPEWPLAAVAAAAWVILLVLPTATRAASPSTTPAVVRAFVCPLGGAGGGPVAGGPATETSPAGLTLMTVAMMTPAGLPAARHVAFNSFRRRRGRALLEYGAAFVSVFVAFGAAVVLAAPSLVGASSTRLPLVAVLAAGAVWQLTRWKRRAVLACRRPASLPASGRRADIGCLRFGAREGARCLAAAWPLMLLVALAHANLALMAVATAVMAVEERPALARRLVRPLAAAFAAAALTVLLYL